MVLRDKWEKNNDVKLKKTLINYNKTDCIALKKVTEFLIPLSYEINKGDLSLNKGEVEFVDNLNDILVKERDIRQFVSTINKDNLVSDIDSFIQEHGYSVDIRD